MTFFKWAFLYTLMKDAESNSLRYFVSTKAFQLSYTVINLDNLHFPGYFAFLDGTLGSTKQP